jgi:hypothetical protein
VNLTEPITNLTVLDLATTNQVTGQATNDVPGRSTNGVSNLSASAKEAIANLEVLSATNNVAEQSTNDGQSTVEAAIANLEALSSGGRVENEVKSPSRRAFLVREESKNRIGKVMQALAAGTIHAVPDEVHESVTKTEVKRDKEEDKTEREEGASETTYPRQRQRQQRSFGIERSLQSLFTSEEVPKREVKRDKETDYEEEARDEERERAEEKESEAAYTKGLQRQQHSHSTIERPLQSMFASEFPSENLIFDRPEKAKDQ